MTTTRITRAPLLATLLALVVLAPQVEGAAKLPDPVMTAFRRAYPKATIQNTLQELKDGKTVYEIESVDRGLRRDLLYAPDGRVLEVEETVPVDSLPPAVRQALKRTAPSAKVIRAERIDREGVESFGISVREKGKPREITFDREGKVLAP